MDLAPADALTLRMRSLLLAPTASGGPRAPTDVAGVVTWFGALQAQDLASGLWSLGARLPDHTMVDVEAALERREALRTWPMRGTVHLVPPRDARWMLDLTGVRSLAGAARRREFLGLTAEVADRAVEVLGAALAGGGRLTRSECMTVLVESGVPVTGQLGYHLLWYASQCGVTCIAPTIGKEQTFVRLDEWVPDPVVLDRDEALGTLALRYFRSHGPTTRQDFAGWTGLTMADVKTAVAVAGDGLVVVTVEGRDMLLAPEVLDTLGPQGDGVAGADIRALPGFDEYLLGYKDRSLMLDAEHKQAIIPGGNGVFQSTVVRDGRVIGTWKRTTTKVRTVVNVVPLRTLSAKERTGVERAFDAYERYLERPVDVVWPDRRS